MSTFIPPRSIATIRLPRSVPALVSLASQVVLKVTGNQNFPSPVPTLAVLTKAIDDLQLAQAQAKARTHGAVVTRNQLRTALVALLQQFRGYVQGIADGDREKSAGIIQSAGLEIRKVPSGGKRPFAVKQGPVTGSAKLSTPSVGRRSSYDWQQSADGGKTWVDLPSSIQTRTVVTGLTPGGTYSFRVRGVTKSGPGDWSSPLPLIVR